MHSQGIEGMYLYACCYLSPRWGFGECVFDVAIHLPPLWGYVS